MSQLQETVLSINLSCVCLCSTVTVFRHRQTCLYVCRLEAEVKIAKKTPESGSVSQHQI